MVALAVTVAMLAASVSASASAAPASAAPAGPIPPELEQALPPGAQNVIAGIRVINSLGARNRVYREANAAQKDLRGYYDHQIATAQQQLLDREQLGLDDSQLRAYQRVKARLEAERAAALQITEDEKNAARLGFESTLASALFGAVIRAPRGRAALGRVQSSITDLRDAFSAAAAAIEGGSPLEAALGPVRDRLERYERIAGLASVVNGRLGRRLQSLSSEVRGVLDRVDQATAEAAGAAGQAIDQLDGLAGEIDGLLQRDRRARGGAELDAAANALLERIFTPGGDEPAADVAAEAIVRGLDPEFLERLGIATGEIDPAGRARMIERVRAQILADTVAGVAERCGRITGEILRQSSGAEIDVPARPCPIFENPTRLTEAARDAGVAAPPPTSTPATPSPPSTSSPPSTPTTPTTTPPPSSPAPLATSVVVSEQLAVDGHQGATTVDVTVTYDSSGPAEVSIAAAGSMSWDETFGCNFDNDPNRPTGDTATVRYTLAYTAASSTRATLASDGSGIATMSYPVDGAVTFALTKPFASDCAHLNGEPAPDAGPYPGSGEIAVVIASDRSVSVSTDWTGRFGHVSGAG
jgi:hypothetical protein